MHTDAPLAFLIPLRPRDDEARWNTAVHLLRQTLGSLLAQASPSWVAVIAGHDRPAFLDDWADPRIMFHRVDWEAPHPRGPRIDRSWKVAFASMMASRLNPTYYMVLDADDLLRDDLVDIVSRHAGSPAIIFDRGWEIDLRFGRALRRDHLASICGSTAALSTREFPLPQGRGWDEWEKVPYIHHGHNEIKALLASRGLEFAAPGDRCVAYVVGHEASLCQRHLIRPWKRWLGFHLLGRRITPDLARQFAMQPGIIER